MGFRVPFCFYVSQTNTEAKRSGVEEAFVLFETCESNEHRGEAKRSRGERSPFIRRRSGVEEAFVLFEGEDNLIDIYLDSLL